MPDTTAPSRASQVYWRIFLATFRAAAPGSTSRELMTSSPTREIVDARRHGVIDGYILKPVSAATLLEEIRACRRSEKQK